ncbi:DASH complex subunit Dad2-domain-containing protein [Elsinoe ampelina]|uniref:DASH complex subunit DAD2 n=1 Tax=Elsinoe ampelina TaxID=302913 RepID=A0A6A6GN94_9PEZI|nr:DASH complex subunit Dad2-domain-containing protein [Elsinoe ampelina]
MSYRSVGQTSGLRQPSLAGSGSTQSSALQQRIIEKKAELENLKQLRDLSAGLAGQMEQLEQKLSTLSTGTEAVAAVLSNWHNVLRAISLASNKIPVPKESETTETEEEPALPQTLVRIPIHHIKPAADASNASEASGVK